MKLYTEEQVLRMLEVCRDSDLYEHILTFEDILKTETPIELPSDEEIKEQAHIQCPVNLQPNGRTLAGGKYDVDINYSERNGFIQCAKWMRDKIRIQGR